MVGKGSLIRPLGGMLRPFMASRAGCAGPAGRKSEFAGKWSSHGCSWSGLEGCRAAACWLQRTWNLLGPALFALYIIQKCMTVLGAPLSGACKPRISSEEI